MDLINERSVALFYLDKCPMAYKNMNNI